MKSIITTLAIFIGIIAQAQIEKGTMSIGTTLDGNYDRGVNNYQFNNVTSYNWGFKLTPTFEYFVKNNLSVGAGIGYGIQQNIRNTEPLTTNQFPTTIANTIENYSVSLFVRKFWTVNKKLGVYIQPKLSSFYNETTNKNKVDNPAFPENLQTAYTYSNYWNHNLNLNAGVHYFVTPKWSLKAETLVSQANITKSTQTFRLFYTNINLTFGINYFFGKK
jgi:hypothetical protein